MPIISTKLNSIPVRLYRRGDCGSFNYSLWIGGKFISRYTMFSEAIKTIEQMTGVNYPF